jgi:glycosyltransferase involved in cell wall biosynthesis
VVSGVDLLGVVVPARDEAELLPACLAALAVAAGAPELDGVAVQVVVVADGCTDATAAVARAAGATVLETGGVTGNVGHARHRGARWVLAAAGQAEVPADRVWLAATDADSRVPADWMSVHLTAASSGADAFVGTVAVEDWAGLAPEAVAAFGAAYDAWRPAGDPHPHVHGANLGVRGSAYLRAGGFPPLPVSEDHGLVDALVRSGASLLRSPLSPVLTSARRVARARGGFGTDLQRLAAHSGPG